MSGEMRADSDAMRHAASAFDTLAAGVSATHGRLRAALDGAGACWGTDAAGDRFAAGYLDAATKASAALPALTEALTAVGRAVFDAAGAVDDAEAGARSRFDG